MRRLAFSFLMLAALTAFTCDDRPPPQFMIVSLGLDARFRESRALAINERNEVVGYWYNPINSDDPDRLAFLQRDLASIDLRTLGGTNSEAHAINDRGAVAGTAQIADGNYHAFVWDVTPGSGRSPMIDVHPAGMRGTSRAAGVTTLRDPGAGSHEYDYAVGDTAPQDSRNNTGAAEFSLYWPGATPPSRSLQIPFPVTGVSHANSVAQLGRSTSTVVIVGAMDIGGGVFHAFSLPGTPFGGYGPTRDIGASWGSDPDHTNSEAYGVNTQGVIVGYSEMSDRSRRGFLFTGTWIDLNLLPGGANGEARALTNRNPVSIVGWSEISGGVHHAVLWWGLLPYDLNGNRPDGTPFVRNNPAGAGHWELLEAYDINDSNWIVGVGRLNGHERAFLLRVR